MMALSMSCFGVNEIALRLPSLLFSVLAIAMTYWIAREIGGRRVALVAASLHAVNGFLIELSSGRTATDHVDTLFVVLIEAGILIAIRSREWRLWHGAMAVGLVAGLAALTKSPISLLLVVLWLPLTGTRASRGVWALAAAGLLACAVAAAVYLPWHIYTQQAFSSEAAWESSYNVRHLTEALEGHEGGLFYHVWRIPRFFGELSLLSIAWFLYQLRHRQPDRTRAVVALWLLIPYVFFSLVKTKMAGYVMLAAPPVFIMVALHWWRLRELAGATAGWRRWASIVAMVLLLALPARFCMERVKPMWGPQWHTEWARSMRSMNEQFGTSRVVVFNAERPIELMFYSSMLAYGGFPTEGDIAHAEQEGYRVAVHDSDRLPEWIRSHPRIEVLPP
jgi:4-amino-4-deoxy-L-arabinose transferase